MEGPSFTVVIPSFNRPARLKRCLEALTELKYPRQLFSVIVVDDGSPEPLEPVPAAFADALRVRCVRQRNQGPAAARNHGVQLADDEWIAFTDDDCRPDPLWLNALASEASRAPGAALGGRVINALTGNIYAESSQLLVDYLYDYYRGRPEAPAFFTSNNLAFPAEAFRELGGFDLSFPLAAGEDREVCDRWRRSGRELRFVPQAVVRHEHNLHAKTFLKQHFNYGRGAWQFHQLRARSQGGEVKVEPWGFYWDLLRYPLRRHRAWTGTKASALLFLSQVANIGGYFWQQSRKA